ncbi:hypothetical protein CASFOL_019163 [Castilleja foliolosa]|uniref:WD repeat-containing protein 44 n=1 Tax=Castilleja foliolosa TaxID=1961234 RepID=A0ABD3D6M4_9LAMI
MHKDEEEEEEEEEEQCFHDSLDRLLSSSNTSCSCSPSNSDPEDDPNPSSSDYNDPVLRFPKSVSRNYDVWTSQPSSVDERRLSLLRQMGLTGDPSLIRHRPSLSLSLSISSEHLTPLGETIYGSSDRNSKILDNNSDYVNSSSSSDDSSNCNGRALEMVRSKSDGDIELSNNPGTHGFDVDVNNDNAPIDVNGLCVIKNLDNGKEFMVKEMREDGTWKKIKEVKAGGTQLATDEFSSEMCVGTSPIVQELMRRQNVKDRNKDCLDSNNDGNKSKSKKKGNWLRSLKNVTSSVKGHKTQSSDDGYMCGWRSSSATDDSHDVSFLGPERVRVRHYGKTVKEFTGLYKGQEIWAHKGSIWAIKFSLDGKYLASAGEDRVIHVWRVVETEKKGDLFFDKSEDGNFNLLFLDNGSPEVLPMLPNLEGYADKRRRGRSSISRKSVSFEQILVPETVFGLSDKPQCSFHGHSDDVLDLSWSKSQNFSQALGMSLTLLCKYPQQLLSSSMDKTVRLWDFSSKSCLKIFSHSDYVTCIQFNPVDDRYFISGSLDSKVRIWNIPDRKVVDWSDLHEMVTAACYTPDGQGALVGSYKGSCRLYNTSENKLLQKSQINLQKKKKKSLRKKITGFQFAPGSSSEVLITSADSRIRVIDGVDLVHKFKGFRNTNSQISASLTSNGKYTISASEDSNVYVWKHKPETRPNRTKGVTVTQSYECFHCPDVSLAIPWPGPDDKWPLQNTPTEGQNGDFDRFEDSISPPLDGRLSNGYLFDKKSVTFPEEKLISAIKNRSPRVSVDFSNGFYQNRSAWGMVIVTAGLKGEIKTFQNFGLPVRI